MTPAPASGGRGQVKIVYIASLGATSTAMAEAIRSTGAEVHTLDKRPYIAWGGALLSRIQRRLNRGLGLRAFNRDLLRMVEEIRPDVVWVCKGQILHPETIGRGRRIHDCLWVHENPDDPFGPQRGRHWWKLFYKTLPMFDLHFVPRAVDLQDYAAAGARRVVRADFVFIPSLHTPPPSGPPRSFECDVAFIGRWEPERHHAVELLAREGLRVRVWGPFWPKRMRRPPQGVEVRGNGVYGRAYAEAWWKAKMGLNILTRMNRDLYTVRSFEIPACGCLQLCERTPEHQAFLEEGTEAEFFDTWEEMAEKARHLAEDPARCAEMGLRGAERVRRDGRDAVSKARRQIDIITEMLNDRGTAPQEQPPRDDETPARERATR